MSLPLKKGRAGTMTRNYKRNSTSIKTGRLNGGRSQ